MRNKKYQLIQVEWVDSTSWDGWHSVEDAREEVPLTIKSVGYLIKSDKKHINIVGCIDNQDRQRTARQMVIPRGCVKSIKRIQE